MHKDNYILLLAFIMLVLGGCIYLFFRKEVIFTSWIPDVWLHAMPNYCDKIDSNSLLGRIFLYSLPDGLWYGSLLLVDLLLRSNTSYSRVITLLTISLPFIFELLQLCHIMRGTFDWIDITIYLLTLYTFLLCSRKFYFKC